MSYDHDSVLHFMGFKSQQIAKMREIQVRSPVIPGHLYICTGFLEAALFFPEP